MRAAATDTDGIHTNPPLMRLQASTAATSLGKWAFALALGVYAFRVGGAAAVGLVALLQAIPAAVAAPLLGLAGDRQPRQRVLLITNLSRTILVAAVAALIGLDVGLAPIVLLAIAFSVISTANQPARAALIPVLARTPREVSAATAAMGTVDIASFLIGAGVGGVLLSATSTEVLVACCAVAYFVSTILIAGIPQDTRPVTHTPERPLSELVAGFKSVSADGQLREAIGLLAALSIVDGLTNVLVIVTAIELLGTGTAGIGYLNIAYGVGGMAGGAATFALLRRSHLLPAIVIGSLAIGVPLAGLGISPGEIAGLAAWAGVGFGIVAAKVSGLTLVQRLSGDRVLARVLAVAETTFVISIGIGAIFAPVLISLFGVTGALIATAAILPLVVALRWAPLRRLELGAPVPQKEFELIRHCPVFAPLPLATSEGLARRIEHENFDAGANVITQGEAGDRFFIIASGEVEVIEDGEFRRVLTSGDSFGEIALLRTESRTATIVAKQQTALLTIDRESFLTSVTGYADSHEAALGVANRYLKPADART